MNMDMEAMAAIARSVMQTGHEDGPQADEQNPHEYEEEDGPRAFEMTFVQDTEHGQMELVLRLPPRLVAVLGGQLLAWLADGEGG